MHFLSVTKHPVKANPDKGEPKGCSFEVSRGKSPPRTIRVIRVTNKKQR